jgi:CRISPR-associated endoribonuclease Cas6
MRLHLRLTPNTQLVPYNHLHQLTGVVHKWLGDNTIHDEISLYSLGWLEGAVPVGGALSFPQGAAWSLSFHHPNLIQQLQNGIKNDATVAYGMRVYREELQPTPRFGSIYRFEVGSPVLVRKSLDETRQQHLSFDDPEADVYLTRTLRRKLKMAGFEGGHLDTIMGFDRNYARPRSKLVEIKGIRYKANICPVIVAGTPEAVQFAWQVGAGHLTGSGMGFLK